MKHLALSPFYHVQKEIQYRIKRLKRKKMLLKIKAFLLIVLPVLIVLIGIQVLKTYLHIRLRELCIREKHKKKQSKQRNIQKEHPE